MCSSSRLTKPASNPTPDSMPLVMWIWCVFSSFLKISSFCSIKLKGIEYSVSWIVTITLRMTSKTLRYHFFFTLQINPSIVQHLFTNQMNGILLFSLFQSFTFAYIVHSMECDRDFLVCELDTNKRTNIFMKKDIQFIRIFFAQFWIALALWDELSKTHKYLHDNYTSFLPSKCTHSFTVHSTVK